MNNKHYNKLLKQLNILLCLCILICDTPIALLQPVSAYADTLEEYDCDDVNLSSSVSSNEADNSNLDYVLGRPMTEEEIEEQFDLIPDNLSPLPYEEPTEMYVAEFSLLGDFEDSLPASYDSREEGYTTSVKKQGNTNLCWSFATVGALETSIKMQNFEDDPDLSEFHLAYYSAHTGYDELGNTCDLTGNTNIDYCSSVGDYINAGGVSTMSTIALSNWKGAAYDSDYPLYTTVSDRSELEATMTPGQAYSKNAYYLKNSYCTPMDDMESVKKLVMNYGSIFSGMYFNKSTTYYNASTASYYYYVNEGENIKSNDHAVLIVGWDDNYSRENFSKQPSRDGAWIIKNSWGSDFGKEGYFYASYDDVKINNSETKGAAYVVDPKDSELNNYYYSGGVHFSKSFSVYGVAEQFTAKGNNGFEEIIEKAGFMTNSSGINYTVRVYVNPSTDGSIDWNNYVLEEYGCTTYSGYVTHEFEEPLTVTAGDTFIVYFIFDKAVSVNFDVTGSASSICYSHNTVKNGESFFKLYEDNNTLTDGANIDTYGITPRMNIITRDKCDSIKITKSSLDVSGNIGLNLYADIPYKYIISGAYAILGDQKIQLPSTIVSDESSLATATENTLIQCKFRQYMAAKELNDDIELSFYDSNNNKIHLTNKTAVDNVYSYSVMRYINDYKRIYTIDKYPDKAATINLLDALTSYGLSSQEYFDYKASEITDSDIPEPDISNLEAYKKNFVGDLPAGLTYVGSSLLLETKTKIRHYFRVDDTHNISDYSFSITSSSGKVTKLTPASNGNLYYISISNIPCYSYRNMFALTIDDCTLNYGVYSYIYSAMQTDNDKLHKISSALYNYGEQGYEYNNAK